MGISRFLVKGEALRRADYSQPNMLELSALSPQMKALVNEKQRFGAHLWPNTPHFCFNQLDSQVCLRKR